MRFEEYFIEERSHGSSLRGERNMRARLGEMRQGEAKQSEA